jgi:tripartite-type tricarboxylate transporter receptor subunit TctC
MGADKASTHPNRKNPGQLEYGSGGVGSTPHFATAMLRAVTGVKMNHVRYWGGGPALTALMVATSIF